MSRHIENSRIYLHICGKCVCLPLHLCFSHLQREREMHRSISRSIITRVLLTSAWLWNVCMYMLITRLFLFFCFTMRLFNTEYLFSKNRKRIILQLRTHKLMQIYIFHSYIVVNCISIEEEPSFSLKFFIVFTRVWTKSQIFFFILLSPHSTAREYEDDVHVYA